MTRSILLYVLPAFLATLPVSDDAAAAPSQPAMQRFGKATEIARIDVGVVDAKGRPVRDLKAGDFVLEEDGVQQEIANVQFVTPMQSKPSEVWAADRVSSNTDPAMPTGGSLIVVLDDLHLSPDGADRARTAIIDFVKRLPEHERISVISTSGRIWCTGVTSRRDASLVAALQRLTGLHVQDSLAMVQMTEYEAMRIAQYDDAAMLKNVEKRQRRERYRIEQNRLMAMDRGVASSPFGTIGGDDRPMMPTNETDILDDISLSTQIMAKNLKAGASDSTTTAKSLAATLNTLVKRRRAQVILSLRRILLPLTATTDRKAVILMSERFIDDPIDPQCAVALDVARRANAAVYVVGVGGAVDPDRRRQSEDRGVGLEELDAINDGFARIASDGGGSAITGSNDLTHDLERIADEYAHYYLLEYRPSNAVPDGDFHRIRVSVNRPGVLVRSRPGRFAVPDAASQNVPAGDEDALEKFHQVLDAPVPMPDVPLRMSSYTLESKPGRMTRTLLVSELRIDGLAFEKKDDRFVADVDVFTSVRHHGTGKTYDEQQVTVRITARSDVRGQDIWHRLSREILLPEGPCQARLMVRDQKSGHVGSVIHPLNVPGGEQWRISSPVISDMMRLSEDGAERAVPVASRRFAASGTLYLQFESYGGAIDKTTDLPRISRWISLVGEDGKTENQYKSAPIVPSSDRRLVQLVSIPLRGLKPGNYYLDLHFTDEIAGRTIELREPFSLELPRRPTLELYRDLLLDYKEGDEETLRKLLAWEPADVARIAPRIISRRDDLHRAAALLHTEAAMRQRLSRPDATAVHFSIARDLLARAEPESVFRRDWLLAVGYRLQAIPDPVAALPLFTECRDAFQSSAEAWLATGTVYEFSAYTDGLGGTSLPGDAERLADEAVTHYRKALSLDPSLAEARLRLGRVLERLGRREEALRELELLTSESDDALIVAMAHLFLGDILEELGRTDKAAAHYRAALDRDPALQPAGTALSRILWRNGRRQDAREVLERTLRSGWSSGTSRWLVYHFDFRGRAQSALEKLQRLTGS